MSHDRRRSIGEVDRAGMGANAWGAAFGCIRGFGTCGHCGDGGGG